MANGRHILFSEMPITPLFINMSRSIFFLIRLS